MLLTWIFKGLVGVDGRRCMVEMNGNEADEGKWGSGVCVLNPREMGRCDLHCSSIGTAILFCDRLCLNQKTYYWKHKSSKQNITMNISPYAGIETTLRVFFFFSWQNLPVTVIGLNPGNLYELRLKAEWMHRFHKKNTEASWVNDFIHLYSLLTYF